MASTYFIKFQIYAPESSLEVITGRGRPIYQPADILEYIDFILYWLLAWGQKKSFYQAL